MEGWENVVGKWSVGIWLLYPSITSCSTPLHDFQHFWFLTMIHILKMRYFSPCKERFFSREGNFGQRRQMEKKKKKNWEDKEGNIFTEEKEGQGKGAIVTWLDIKGTTRTGKNAGSACIAIYANFLVIALISTFLEQKVPCFMFYKKEYDVYYTFKTYFIHFKRPWALQQLLQNQS